VAPNTRRTRDGRPEGAIDFRRPHQARRATHCLRPPQRVRPAAVYIGEPLPRNGTSFLLKHWPSVLSALQTGELCPKRKMLALSSARPIQRRPWQIRAFSPRGLASRLAPVWPLGRRQTLGICSPMPMPRPSSVVCRLSSANSASLAEICGLPSGASLCARGDTCASLKIDTRPPSQTSEQATPKCGS